MTGEQMAQVTKFAVAFDRMNRAVAAGEGAMLDAEETAVVVAVIKVFTAKARDAASGVGTVNP